MALLDKLFSEMTRDQLRTVIGENIRRLRKAEGLSQAALAEALEMNQSDISRFENGSDAPKSDELALFGEYFKQSPAYFLLKVESESSKPAGLDRSRRNRQPAA